MTAVMLLADGTDRDEWLEARRHGITATEIGSVLGVNPFQSAFSLFWRKTGWLTEEPDNPRMSLGRHCEPWVADQWATDNPTMELRPGGLYGIGHWHPADGHYVHAPCCRHEYAYRRLATPDRLIHHPGEQAPSAVLEIKTTSSYHGWGPDGGDDIPAHYRAQVLWQMDVCDVSLAHLAVLFLHTRQIRTYTVHRDDADLEVMRQAAHRFWRDHIHRDVPPSIDADTSTTDALKVLYPEVDDRAVTVEADLADEYRGACMEVKAAEERKRLAENLLRHHLGDGARACDPDGNTLATRSVYDMDTLDRKTLKRDYPELAAQYATRTRVNKITRRHP